ncbi:MAG: sulfatase-like hydrolase/transferase [Phycisphaeraceae bacterium]|nr:sulfatase-like hydrolase/transferase [Phycisphaeraceae bacterium]
MSDTTQPNILWITTDRQRFDSLGCYGNSWVTTPHLDRMAQQGVRFEQAWCQNPICGPSRASFLTGRYPSTTRLNRNAQRLPSSERLISRILADNGYVCGLAGKYHLAPSSQPIADWCEPRGNDGYSVFDWSMHPPDVPVSQYTAWLSEHDIQFKREPVRDSKYVTFGMDENTSNTAWITQRAINFLKVSAKIDRPWMFSMNIEDPHDPIDPPRRFLEPYLERLDEIPLPEFTPGELDNKPYNQRMDHHGVYGGGRMNLKDPSKKGGFAYSAMSDEDHRLIRAGYWAMIDHIDYQVGRVLDALSESGQLENTLVLFMSDHGEMLGDHGIYFQGPYFYEPMMHVPLLFQLPSKLEAGMSIPAMMELIDLAPTLLDAAGIAPEPGMQGRSLWPMLLGQTDQTVGRESVYFEYYDAIPGDRHHPGGRNITGVRNDKFALSAVHGSDEGELYDLCKDPGEKNNLWDNPDLITVKADMLKHLCDRMFQTIDPLPVTEACY